MNLTPDIYPVITLIQPWATWIMREWKDIETRTHAKFACLLNKTALIHAGKTTDASAINNPYLTKEQLLYNPDEVINGFILGKVYVYKFGLLSPEHSKKALIECNTKRFGLFLKDVKKIQPIPESGELGVWYYDLANKRKVRLNEINSQPQLFQ